MESVETGAYDTCLCGCKYCYANDEGAVMRRRAEYDCAAPLLCGRGGRRRPDHGAQDEPDSDRRIKTGSGGIPMKKHLRILFPLLLGLLVAISAVSIKRISDIRDYGKLINYVGIVRGASQRVVKLETNGRPDDELIGYVDDILDELVTGHGTIWPGLHGLQAVPDEFKAAEGAVGYREGKRSTL